MAAAELFLSRIPSAQLQQWLVEYREIFVLEFDKQSYLCRPINISEFNSIATKFPNIQEDPEEQMAMEDEIAKLCILYPQFNINTCIAGLPTSIANQVLERSGFSKKDQYITNVINTFDNEMQIFVNQIPCIIAAAFPAFDIEEIEKWPTLKVLKYLSRAKWTLENLKQNKIVVNGVGEDEANDGDDSMAFPELKAEQDFMSGKL